MLRSDVRLSARGREEIEAELTRLQDERPEAAARIADARHGGTDASENLDLRDALDALAVLEARITELRTTLGRAEPLEAVVSDGTARIGNTVRLRREDGEEATYTLVSPPEASPRRGRISVASPIGRAIVGHHQGEEVLAETPAGAERLSLLAVA